MKIEIEKEDILKEIAENHSNDTYFFYQIIDRGTTSWEPVIELTKKLVDMLRKNGELKVKELLDEQE